MLTTLWRKTKLERGELVGVAVAIAATLALSAALVPLRGHMSVPIPALALVLPVVLGVAIGGFRAGLVAVATGFFAFDFVFIPPYATLAVGHAEDWAALLVYVLVVLVVARLVANLRETQVEAQRHADTTRRILELSDALISDRPVGEFLARAATNLLEAFQLGGVAVMLPEGAGLQVVATAGEAIPREVLSSLVPSAGTPRRLSDAYGGSGTNLVVPLSAAAGPLGVVVLTGAHFEDYDRHLVNTYANQLALALERSQLREQAIKSQLLEEVDRWRDALIGAVSHDLRTPLAVIKAAVSNLLDPELSLKDSEREELLRSIEDQADRLARLVVNTLDMTRIRAGALTARVEPRPVRELLAEALATLPRETGDRVVAHIAPEGLSVAADRVLIAQVLANLVENADRHGPPGTPIEFDAVPIDGKVEISVIDHGQGVEIAERERVFDMFSRVSGAGRAGLGLAIARSFVEAHGGAIGVDTAPGGGARFYFTVDRVA